MGDAARARHFFHVETIGQVVGTVPNLLTSTKFDGGNREVHLVDEIRVEERAQGGHATAEADVLAVRRLERLRQRIFGRRIDEVERRVAQRDRRPREMCKDEHWCVEGRVLQMVKSPKN